MTSATNGTNTLSFAYNADGLRTSKTVNGVTYQYYYADGKLIRQTDGTTTLDFFYDANGFPYIMKMGNNIYYYITNAQGDVIRVVDIHGNTAAYYKYDPYGKVTHASGSHANINPLKYRAYLHDTETSLYYLQSRYYDPEIGRFLNIDAFASTGQGLLSSNVFVYCSNNSINFQDSSGYMMIPADPLKGGPARPTSKDEATSSSIIDFICNTDPDKVLQSEGLSFYYGIPVFTIDGERSGSFGAIFLTRTTKDSSDGADTLRHEYGHTIQFAKLGVLKYAVCMGLPSWQNWGDNSYYGDYYNKPWEVMPDVYGGVQSRHPDQKFIDKGIQYEQYSQWLGPVVWMLIE